MFTTDIKNFLVIFLLNSFIYYDLKKYIILHYYIKNYNYEILFPFLE